MATKKTHKPKVDPVGRAYKPRARAPQLSPAKRRDNLEPLDVTATLRGKNILVVGGTGFLGKVLLSLILKRFPDVGHIYLMVRGKGGLTSKDRFEQEVWPTPCLDPCRSDYTTTGEAGKVDLYTKLTPLSGDVVSPLVGLSDEWIARLTKEGVDVICNVAGVVSFDPPLDEGMNVNVVGVQNLLELAQKLRPGCTKETAVPILHTSTCYVAGARSGVVPEDDPRDWPFPRCDVLDRSTWDPARELHEGMAIAEHLRARVKDADLQSLFLERAKSRLREQSRPTTGEPLQQAIAKERDKWIDDELGDAGMKRAKHWGWPNTYTYTKSIGEQLLAGSGQPYTIVRPAVVESSMEYPFPGWNEGINTSAPLIYLVLHGLFRVPSRDGHMLDIIPVDYVCAGTVVSLAALLRGDHAKVYQYGSTDTNGLTMNRFGELMALHKRRYLRARTRGNPLLNRTMARFGPRIISPEAYHYTGARMHAEVLSGISSGLSVLSKTPAKGVAKAAKKQVDAVQKQVKIVDTIINVFLPFISEHNYVFRCDHTREEFNRCVPHDRALLPWNVEGFDWREYICDVHAKGLKKWVFPHLEAKLTKRPRAEDRFSDLVAFLDEVGSREGSAIAVQRIVDAQLSGISYRELRRRAFVAAARLADIGVHPGTRVGIVAKNSPEWAIAFFGVLAAGGCVVPLDPSLSEEELGRRMTEVKATFAIVGDGAAAPEGAACLDLTDITEAPHSREDASAPEILISPNDTAVIAYTAGVSGVSKPVVLTHKNMTSVLASVAPLFKITRHDSGLSVLPLTSTFELTCGLLLPLLRGARVTYVDDVTADSLAEAFKVAGITAMIGVPQVWEDLEEKLQGELQDAGPFAEAAYQAGLFVNKTLGKTLGINLGRVLFSPIHDRIGGRVRFLVSTGGPVPKKTADTFKALGVELHQSYGLTEAAPVLAVGDVRGTKAVPGVQVEIRDVMDDGIGEIVAKGDQVMQGYVDEELTAQALLEGGWLRTGDLGRIDKDGRITVVARADEVISLASGQRIYPRPIAEALSTVKGVKELCIVGLPDGQGGERLSCLATATDDSELDVVERAIAWAARKLDEHERPTLIKVSHTALPRTAQGKLLRTQAIAMLVALVAEAAQAPEQPTSTALSTTQNGKHNGKVISPSQVLSRGQRDAHEERLAAPGQKKPKNADDDAPLAVPQPMRDLVKAGLGALQQGFYQRVMHMDVEGQQHIPWDRPTIVAANHASHLDMGLIKMALGAYGNDLVALAAKDYFFEGKWRRTYFEQFTNLRPLDRGDNPREAMREASALLEAGTTVLIFPEGTRTKNGELSAFRPAVAWLALKHDVDILPVYVDGTYRSMPRGSFVPKNRKVGARIGEPLSAAVLREATTSAGLRTSAACQKIAIVVQKAVEALRDERTFHLERALDEVLGRAPKNGASHGAGQNGAIDGTAKVLTEIFTDLERRFQKAEVKEPVTWYFSLGEGKETKWTVQVSPEHCLIVNDKLDGRADCVFKTDAKTFTKIIKDHYIPDVSEFLNGTVKTNNPELLTTFIQVFNL